MDFSTGQCILLHDKDNTLTALLSLDAGQEIALKTARGIVKLTLRDEIPYAHKFARHDIEAGEDIIKYGEVIGSATSFIPAGAHVHVHNVKGKRA
ncbi:UxaA family hydrolase [Marispirochaeta aestuarii]|uniref:UxaA family hydrolase n=1 Tax=Marispirochaeta aestuarii TaxID=1963862 RepID=UPI002ABD1AA3|nr:UxaA family hydrolase [Marispirochaeta aestuarii]